MTIIAFSRVIGPVPINCIISEQHASGIEITGNPIETGAEVNDHAYVKPKELTLEIGDNNAAETFNALVRFQESRVPFNIVSGFTVYEDMLIENIDATRDATFSRVLNATISLRQVIIVSTASTQSEPGSEPTKGEKGQQGGKKSKSAATPKAETTKIPDRAAQTVTTGDNPTATVPTSTGSQGSLLYQAFQ